MLDPAVAAPTYFLPSYAEARAGFLKATADAAVHTIPHPLTGPKGETLATDCAWIGPERASRVLLVTSGVHGVEGFTGSATQLDWLASARSLPADTAVLLVHAINPHGFAWHRRVTEEGCDLNRNFVDFAQPLPENPLYDAIADVVVPREWTGPGRVQADQALAAAIDQHGLATVMAAISSGQHRHPTGLFFGGTGPTWSRRTFEALVEHYRFADRAHICHIDVHTGLGQFGHGEVITYHPPQSGGVERAVAWWGPSCAPMGGAGSIATPRTGLMPDAVERVAPGRYTFGALEFGTHPMARGRLALRADHWLYAYGKLGWDDPAAVAIRTELTEFFRPVDQSWRELVIFRTRQVVARALAGLATV
jgi:hypothetical protein